MYCVIHMSSLLRQYHPLSNIFGIPLSLSVLSWWDIHTVPLFKFAHLDWSLIAVLMTFHHVHVLIVNRWSHLLFHLLFVATSERNQSLDFSIHCHLSRSGDCWRITIYVLIWFDFWSFKNYYYIVCFVLFLFFFISDNPQLLVIVGRRLWGADSNPYFMEHWQWLAKNHLESFSILKSSLGC